MDRRAFIKSTAPIIAIIAGYHPVVDMYAQDAKPKPKQYTCALKLEGEERMAVVKERIYNSGAMNYIVWVLPKDADKTSLEDYLKTFQEQYMMTSKKNDISKLEEATLQQNAGAFKVLTGKELDRVQLLYNQVQQSPKE